MTVVPAAAVGIHETSTSALNRSPQPPGRTPRGIVLRASGTTHPRGPQCLSACLRHDVRPGGEDRLPHRYLARIRHDHRRLPRAGRPRGRQR